MFCWSKREARKARSKILARHTSGEQTRLYTRRSMVSTIFRSWYVLESRDFVGISATTCVNARDTTQRNVCRCRGSHFGAAEFKCQNRCGFARTCCVSVERFPRSAASDEEFARAELIFR